MTRRPWSLPELPQSRTGAAIKVLGVASQRIDRDDVLAAPGFSIQVRPFLGLLDRSRWSGFAVVFTRPLHLRFADKVAEGTSGELPTSTPVVAEAQSGGATPQARRVSPVRPDMPAGGLLLPEEAQVTVSQRPADSLLSAERTSDATATPTELTTWLTSPSVLLMSAAPSVEMDRSLATVFPTAGLFTGYLAGPDALLVSESVGSQRSPESDQSEPLIEDDPSTIPTQLPENIESVPLAAGLLEQLPFDLPQLSRDIDAFFASLTGSGVEGVQTYARFGPWLAVLCATGLGLAHRWDKHFRKRPALAAEFPLQPDGFIPDEDR